MFEFEVPVGEVDQGQEGEPFPMDRRARGEREPGCPLGPRRAPDQTHPRLLREFPSLSLVAYEATADDVVPRRHTAPGPGGHVVEVQLARRENPSAILACVPVPQEDIAAAEPNVPPGGPVVGGEDHHPGHPDHPAHQADGLLVGVDGEFAPRLEIVHLVLGIDRPREAGVEKAESAPDAGDMHRKKGPVENEHPGVKHLPLGLRFPELLYPPLRPGSIISDGTGASAASTRAPASSASSPSRTERMSRRIRPFATRPATGGFPCLSLASSSSTGTRSWDTATQAVGISTSGIAPPPGGEKERSTCIVRTPPPAGTSPGTQFGASGDEVSRRAARDCTRLTRATSLRALPRSVFSAAR